MTNPGSDFNLELLRGPGEISGPNKNMLFGFMHMFLVSNQTKITNIESRFTLEQQ
jgi:hypothetical protein